MASHVPLPRLAPVVVLCLCRCNAEPRTVLRLLRLVGELLSFCSKVRVQAGREQGWIASGTPHGKVEWSWDAAVAPPSPL